jgi:hypothetical protein
LRWWLGWRLRRRVRSGVELAVGAGVVGSQVVCVVDFRLVREADFRLVRVVDFHPGIEGVRGRTW